MATEALDQAIVALKAAGAKEVYLFGSEAAGTAQAGSDIDLAVRGLPPERYFRALSQASRALAVPLDLVDLDVPTPFTKYLERKGLLRRVG
jgi:predicted nucleotidyltransferase